MILPYSRLFGKRSKVLHEWYTKTLKSKCSHLCGGRMAPPRRTSLMTLVQHDWWIESPGISRLWPLYHELLLSQSCSTLIFLDWYRNSPCSLIWGMLMIICMQSDRSHSSAEILLRPLEVGLFSLLAHWWLSLFGADLIYCAIWIHVKIYSLYCTPWNQSPSEIREAGGWFSSGSAYNWNTVFGWLHCLMHYLKRLFYKTQ